MFKVSVDLGYGYVKGINERGEKFLVRTAVGSGVNRQFSEAFGALNKTYEHIMVSQNEAEKQYFIGDLARKHSRDCSSPFDKNKINHPATKVLLAAAVAKLTENNKEPVHLITGPPLLYASGQKESFVNALSNFQAAIQFSGHGSIQLIKFEKVTIFPQGAAVVYYLLKVYPELVAPGNIFVIIEPGYKTTEILLFEIVNGKRIEPIDGYTTTLETGMHLVEKAVDDAFYNKTGSRLNPAMLDKVMQSDQPVHFQGREINLKEEKEQAKEELARSILDSAKQVLGEYIEYAKKIIFCGGVVEDPFIRPRFQEFFSTGLILEDSQFANAKGLLEAGRQVEKVESGSGKIVRLV